MGELLRLEGITRSFGALKAVDGLSLSLQEGEALGILGPNGAGKSTLFNLVAGHLTPDAGRIVYDGNDITAMPAAERCRIGIGRSFQIPHPFAGMTVFENLLVGAVFGGGLTERAAAVECRVILERTGLAAKANRLAGSLTLLDRKRLELARALATGPRLLLLDEVMAGLNHVEVGRIVDLVGEINAAGLTIIMVEHVMKAIMAACHRVVVLQFGRKIADATPERVVGNADVIAAYLGDRFARRHQAAVGAAEGA